MNKELNVAILSTKEYACIGELCFLDNKLQIFNSITDQCYTNKVNLYFTSDELIKKGDWYIGGPINNPICLTTENKTKDSYLKKIIATTNSSLEIAIISKSNCGNSEIIGCNLPKPSEKWLQEYIENYNSGNIVEKVEVEYNELYLYEDGTKHRSSSFGICIPIEDLKINKDNTINIKPIKTNWTKEEVIALCFKSYNLRTIDEDIRSTESLKIWINENL